MMSLDRGKVKTESTSIRRSKIGSTIQDLVNVCKVANDGEDRLEVTTKRSATRARNSFETFELVHAFINGGTHFGNHQLGVKLPFRLGTFSFTQAPKDVSFSPSASPVNGPSLVLPVSRASFAGFFGKTRMICLGHEASPIRLSMVRSAEPGKATSAVRKPVMRSKRDAGLTSGKE